MPEPILTELSNGDKHWYLNGKHHREDGPAVELPDGYKSWYLNGQLHRTDGPAIEFPTGHKSWYLNGKHYTEEEYALIQFMNGVNVYA